MSLIRNCWKTSSRFRLGAMLLLFFIVLALVGPLIYGPTLRGPDFAIDPAVPGSFHRWLPYSAVHPLGTDGVGRDLMSDYLAGLATSLRIGFVSGLVATIIGTLVGFSAGYFGGKTDTVL